MSGGAPMKTTYGKKRGRGGEECRVQARRQLTQLFVCLILFLAVFIGKEVWPSKIAKTGEQLLAVIHMNTDFRAAFAKLGQSMARENSMLGELGEFCVSVFAPRTEELDDGAADGALASACADGCTDIQQEIQSIEDEGPQPAEQDLLQVGDVVGPAEYTGGQLPEGYSEQWLYLGEMETVVPVMGTVTSQFGYRDHPTIGRYAAHGGVDIAADSGTAVSAFAAGRVDAVGEDKDFGRWVRLSHTHGVESFYAHCSQITVNEGEEVRAGQMVALVGSSGVSTGPHLHFEIRLNGVRLDPMYYIEPSGAV